MSTFAFHNPQLLWLLLLLPLLALLKGRRGKPASLVFSSVAIAAQVSKGARARAGAVLFFLRLLALALLIVALARPQLGKGHSEVEASGIDIVLAVDVSYSMAALDFSTQTKARTRLDAVKEVLDDFIKKRPGDRIGLVAFAVNPYLVSPLTLNHDWLLRNLERIELGLIDGNRTAVGTAIGTSVNRLRDLPDAKSRVLILLTDGENNAGSINPTVAAEAAKAYRVKIYTIMAGAQGGEIPVAALDRDGKIAKDRFGRMQVAGYAAAQNEDAQLRKIAETTDGKFYRASNPKQLREIYDDIDRLEKTTAKLHYFSTYEELFMWPALAALALLGLEALLGATRLRRLP